MMSRTMVKIICIIMAALMILSVGAVVLQVFAADETVAAVSEEGKLQEYEFIEAAADDNR